MYFLQLWINFSLDIFVTLWSNATRYYEMIGHHSIKHFGITLTHFFPQFSQTIFNSIFSAFNAFLRIYPLKMLKKIWLDIMTHLQGLDDILSNVILYSSWFKGFCTVSSKKNVLLFWCFLYNFFSLEYTSIFSSSILKYPIVYTECLEKKMALLL